MPEIGIALLLRSVRVSRKVEDSAFLAGIAYDLIVVFYCISFVIYLYLSLTLLFDPLSLICFCRGCATEEQCTDSTTNEIYDGTKLLQGTELAGGMTTTLTCCKAKDYADDDVIALDYGSICNAAAVSFAPFSVLYFSLVSATCMWFLLSL
jgi:hypothetical protein